MVSVMRIKEVEQDVVLRKEDFESLIGGMESLTETIERISINSHYSRTSGEGGE